MFIGSCRFYYKVSIDLWGQEKDKGGLQLHCNLGNQQSNDLDQPLSTISFFSETLLFPEQSTQAYKPFIFIKINLQVIEE